MLTNANCTIYNKYTNPITKQESYIPTHLYGVFWQESESVTANKSGLNSADSLSLFIPFDVSCDKKYQKPKLYDGQGWTLQKGNIVVKGIVSENIMAKAELENLYDSVFTIKAISTYDFGSAEMQHWQVSGI